MLGAAARPVDDEQHSITFGSSIETETKHVHSLDGVSFATYSHAPVTFCSDLHCVCVSIKGRRMRHPYSHPPTHQKLHYRIIHLHSSSEYLREIGYDGRDILYPPSSTYL